VRGARGRVSRRCTPGYVRAPRWGYGRPGGRPLHALRGPVVRRGGPDATDVLRALAPWRLPESANPRQSLRPSCPAALRGEYSSVETTMHRSPAPSSLLAIRHSPLSASSARSRRPWRLGGSPNVPITKVINRGVSKHEHVDHLPLAGSRTRSRSCDPPRRTGRHSQNE